MAQHSEHHDIIPREKLNFQLDAPDLPKYWFDDDVFKTRFFDALSVIFPPGERFFMTCVRDFRDRVTDNPQLLEDIKAFNRQEGQHTMVHAQFNERLRQQGQDVDGMLKWLENLLFNGWRKWYSKEYTLSQTAALEHFTALGAFMIFGRHDIFGSADPRVRAMYIWHALEEVEHKGVAYDVLQKYAKVGYLRRQLALLEMMVIFPLTIFVFMRRMLKADGYGFFQRVGIFAKGVWWLAKPGGLLAPMTLPFLRYFKPGYHPWDEGLMRGYEAWLAEFKRSGDPVAAGNVVLGQPAVRMAAA